jgi:hypothetical protein
MKLEVFDPAMCCSTGVCGPEVDAALVQFMADVRWLNGRDVAVRRFNLSQEPGAFMSNALVRRTLQAEGVGCLPLGIVKGEVVFKGRYPGRDVLARLFDVATDVS